jgi:hypothetical protein
MQDSGSRPDINSTLKSSKSSTDFKTAFLDITRIDMVISSIWPDIRVFLVSSITPDIWQVKYGIRPDIKKWPNYPASRMSDASLLIMIFGMSGEQDGARHQDGVDEAAPRQDGGRREEEVLHALAD